MFKKIVEFIKSNFLIEKEKLSNIDLMCITDEYECFNYLYGDFILDDFVTFGKKNYLNKDYEDFVFNDLDYFNVYSILNENTLYKFINDKIKNGEKVDFLNLASGAGKLVIFANIFYKLNSCMAVENIFELFELSKHIAYKIFENENYTNLLQNTDISFQNESILNVNLEPFNVILIDYNNNNINFNEILENKIKNECKKGTMIVKIIDPFEESVCLKLLKAKIFKNDKKNNFFVYYYLVE